MNLNMKSIIIHSPYDLRVENYPIEEMDENQIEINIATGGVCGTDLHYYQDGTLSQLFQDL